MSSPFSKLEGRKDTRNALACVSLSLLSSAFFTSFSASHSTKRGGRIFPPSLRVIKWRGGRGKQHFCIRRVARGTPSKCASHTFSHVCVREKPRLRSESMQRRRTEGLREALFSPPQQNGFWSLASGNLRTWHVGEASGPGRTGLWRCGDAPPTQDVGWMVGLSPLPPPRGRPVGGRSVHFSMVFH